MGCPTYWSENYSLSRLSAAGRVPIQIFVIARRAGKRMNLNLADHVTVVTGGASGIGRATALGFAAEGARVAIWDLGEPAANAAAAEIASTAGVLALGVAADVADEGAVRAALA